MTIEIRSAKKSERDIIYNLIQDYLHEFSAFRAIEKDKDGLYQYPYLEFYWGDPSRFPFLIRTRVSSELELPTGNQQENFAGIPHRGSSSERAFSESELPTVGEQEDSAGLPHRGSSSEKAFSEPELPTVNQQEDSAGLPHRGSSSEKAFSEPELPTGNQQEDSAGLPHRGSSSEKAFSEPEMSSEIIAGFALLRSDFDPLTGIPGMVVSEFYVLPAYRNQGIGNAAAVKLWDQFPGQWTVRVMNANKAALPFWQHAIQRYTGGNYQETASPTLNGGNITFIFENPYEDDLPLDIEPELLDY